MKNLSIILLLLLLSFSMTACESTETETEAESKDNTVLTKLETVILDSNMDNEIGVVLIDEGGKEYDIIFRDHFDYNMMYGGGNTTIMMSTGEVTIGEDFIVGVGKDDTDIITFKKGTTYELVFEGNTIAEIRESK